MKVWNNCTEIYSDGHFLEGVNPGMMKSFESYMNKIGHSPRLNVWYDHGTNICFGPEQDYYADPSEFSFFSGEEDFMSNPIWGASHIMQYLGSILGDEVIYTNEYIIQRFPPLKKFENKDILIVGAGPSTNDVDWQSVDVDCVWSCNAFYKHPVLSSIELDLVTVGPGHELDSPEIVDYFEKNNTICMIEAGVSPFRSHRQMSNFKKKFPDQISYYHLRYFSKLGAIPRLICLATFLRARNVYVVGLDGYPIRQVHSFEGDDKEHVGCPLTPGARDRYRREFVLFWDYLLNYLYDNETRYQNLGEGHPANQSTDISEQAFPLKKGLFLT